MPSGIGTKKSGFVKGKWGPFYCGRCEWFDKKAGACNSPDVKADTEITERLPDGRPKVDADDCSNFFWPQGVPRSAVADEDQTRSPHGFPSLKALRREAGAEGESEATEQQEHAVGNKS